MAHPKLWILLLATFAWLRVTTGAERANLDSLVKLYRDYGMPLPVRGAQLVEYSHPGITVVNGEEQQPQQHLAFLLKEDEQSLVLLVGPIMKEMGKEEIVWKVVAPSAVEPAKIEMESFGLSVFEVNTRLAVALQFQALGERRLAAAFFDGCMTQDCGHPYFIFFQPAGLSPQKGLAHLAWAWLANRLLEADSSRRALLQTAKKLLKAAPELKK